MNFLIVDNDATIRKGLIDLLKKVLDEPSQFTEADGVQSGLTTIRSGSFDVVFLDVEMDDGTGFDLLGQLKDFSFQLVIITAFNKYAVEAFKFCAINFIEKPIDVMDLIETLKRVRKNTHQKDLETQVHLLREKLVVGKVMKRIALNDSENIHYVQIDQIIKCESEGSYTTFYLTEKRKIVVSRILKEYEELLADYGFVRVHHSHLINKEKVIRYDKTEGGQIVLDENHTSPVSKRKKEQVLALLKF